MYSVLPSAPGMVGLGLAKPTTLEPVKMAPEATWEPKARELFIRPGNEVRVLGSVRGSLPF